MPFFITEFKTAFYRQFPNLTALLEAGATVEASSINDPQLRQEIIEGGGAIWLCRACGVVHSPNRPGDCDLDDTMTFEALVPPTAAELREMREADMAHKRERKATRRARDLARFEARRASPRAA